MISQLWNTIRRVITPPPTKEDMVWKETVNTAQQLLEGGPAVPGMTVWKRRNRETMKWEHTAFLTEEQYMAAWQDNAEW